MTSGDFFGSRLAAYFNSEMSPFFNIMKILPLINSLYGIDFITVFNSLGNEASFRVLFWYPVYK